MSTIPTIEAGHFHGGKNLNAGQRLRAEATLEEILTAAKADLVNMGQTPTLTPGAEAADVIPVAFQSTVAAVQQYMAEVMDDTTMEVTTAAFTLAETDTGAEVSPTARGRLIFTTDALGAAELSVTDVAGASGKSAWLTVKPMIATGDAGEIVAETAVELTFD